MARLLFLASLIIAFAHPYKENDKRIVNNSENLVAVYIDNSMSMQSLSSEKTLFEDARTSALKIVESLNPTQKFVLMSNDRDARNEHPMNKDEMLLHINEMKVESSPVSFEDIYNNLTLIRRKNGFKCATLFAYSDFQENMMKSNDFKVDSSIQIIAIPLKSDFRKNIYIDSVWVQSPILLKNMTHELNVRVVNETSTEIKGLPVNFSIDENIVAYSAVDVKPNSHSDVNMQFVIESDGCKKAKVLIEDFPITFDDEYNVVLEVCPKINVVEIKPNNVNTSLELLFENDEMIDYQMMGDYNIDRDVIQNAQMLVVNETANLNETMQQILLDFAEQGGSVLLLNGINTNNSYIYGKLGIKMLNFDDNQTKIEYIAKRNSFFDDVFVKVPDNTDLPIVNKHYGFDLGENVLNLLSLQNGDPLLMMKNVGKGKAFVMSTSFDEEYSDLANHALFVPLMYKMAMYACAMSELSYTIGVDKSMKINDITLAIEDRISVKSEKGMFESYPLVENKNNINYINFFEELPYSGFYDILKNDSCVSLMAWNDDRKESEMSFLNEDELTKVLKDNKLNVFSTIRYDEMKSDDMVENLVADSNLWKVFVVLSLIFLLIEILILRFWK